MGAPGSRRSLAVRLLDSAGPSSELSFTCVFLSPSTSLPLPSVSLAGPGPNGKGGRCCPALAQAQRGWRLGGARGACFVSGVHLLRRHRSVLGRSSCCGEGRVFVPFWRSLRERIAQLRMHLRCSRLERDRRAGEQASTRAWIGCPIWQAMRRFSSLSPSFACVLGLCFPDTASHVYVYGLGALG